MKSYRILALFAATLAAAASASAVTFFTDFDSASDGAPASTFNTVDLSFHYGVRAPLQDGDGIDIPGSNQWQIDPAYTAFVSNPFNQDYGAAPSGSLALNVTDGPVLITFAYDVNIQSFSVGLDNSTFGNLMPTSIDFVNGSTVAYSQAIDQSVSGLVVNVGPVSGVRSIVLPTTAFYDNLNITFTAAAAIPEPSTYTALAGVSGLALAVYRRRRRRAC